jgi:hypothetical protein
MTQGLSTALFEHSVLDPRFGHVVNHDFAGYHIVVNADVRSIEADFLEGQDDHTNPMGSKGIGEVCCVGTAAAVATPCTTPPGSACGICPSRSTSCCSSYREPPLASGMDLPGGAILRALPAP